MALLWRFIAKSWLSAGAIWVLSTVRGGGFPIVAGADDLLGQTDGIRANWQSGDRQPGAHNVELEVTNDAHQEHSNGVGGGHRRRRQRAGGRSSDQEGGAGRIRQGLQC